MRTVYPRWRGEHIFKYFSDRAMCGLSPLARGTPATVIFYMFNLRFIPAGAGTLKKTQHYTTDARFIPAGAGNTVIARLSMCAGAVYPRWRGEHPMTLFYSFPFTGLSPLAREHTLTLIYFCYCGGLSPLARGTRARLVPGVRQPRFIPAGAGTLTGDILPVAAFGLSPLARGTLLPIASRARIARFIPAGAGTLNCAIGNRVRSGLSPLARGTLCNTRRLSRSVRFIPAGAGNTTTDHHQADQATVYPRWRGEHANMGRVI